MGKTDEGLTTGRDAVDAAEAALGSEHPVLALALNNYAFFLKARMACCLLLPCLIAQCGCAESCR